jgi:cytochrome oxidase Cu insertion factor (SCO1/SenC/PrrC family)
MFNIKHDPQVDTKKVIEHYEQKDGVSIAYVCTTDISTSDNPVDVFFRESPHPEFGNRYFGLRNHSGSVYITNADQIEELSFAMITDNEGTYHYSQSHHDYKEIDGKMIDGGREYIRSTAGYELFKVKDGQFVLTEG